MADTGFDTGPRAPQELRGVPLTIEMKGYTVPSDKHPERNEDSAFFSEKTQVFGVFDGVSQGGKGQIAANLTRDYVHRSLDGRPQGMSVEQAKWYLAETLVKADALVSKRARVEGQMLTTASIGVIWQGKSGEQKLIIANVGDSRVYILRDRKLQQITLDDNYVRGSGQNQTKDRKLQAKFNNTIDPRAQLTLEERNLLARRNVVTQAVGGGEMEPRLHVIDLKKGDVVMACSDGVSDNLTDREMEALLRTNTSLDTLKRQLTQASVVRSRAGTFRSKPDDMTVVLIKLS